MSFDLTALNDMKKFAEFGQAVLELAKETGIVPKRARRIVVTKERTKVVIRKPRRTNAQIAADTATEAASGNPGN